MRRHSNATEVREQNSIFYFSPDHADDNLRPSSEIYTKMFIDDVSQSLLPA